MTPWIVLPFLFKKFISCTKCSKTWNFYCDLSKFEILVEPYYCPSCLYHQDQCCWKCYHLLHLFWVMQFVLRVVNHFLRPYLKYLFELLKAFLYIAFKACFINVCQKKFRFRYRMLKFVNIFFHSLLIKHSQVVAN